MSRKLYNDQMHSNTSFVDRNLICNKAINKNDRTSKFNFFPNEYCVTYDLRSLF